MTRIVFILSAVLTLAACDYGYGASLTDTPESPLSFVYE